MKKFQKVSAALAALALVLLATAQGAFAAITVDYAGLATGVETEISSALTAWLPLAGVILGIGVAWSVGRRFLR